MFSWAQNCIINSIFIYFQKEKFLGCYIHFQFLGEKVRCYFNSYTTYEQSKKNHSRRRRWPSRHQKNQPLWNEWEDDEQPEEPVKQEPTPPKSSPQSKQVWKEKVTSSESQEVQPSGSPLLRPDDAPEEWMRLESSPVRRT